MKAKFLNTVYRYSMFSSGQRLVVGVSGGADSMCLLHLLLECRDELGITVEAAHVNHCIRGEEADSDEEFVRVFCEKNGVVFHSIRADIPRIAQETGESTELCARRIRYSYFDSLEADVIATAHTGSDRIETMLMNLSRGASLNGLCSIPAVRGNIVRPLIDFTRAEIEKYCADNNIDYVTDSTNLTDDYTRNRFRHNVISELVKINPAFESNALRCIGSINSDNIFLEDLTDENYGLCLTHNGDIDVLSLSKLPSAMQKRVVIRYISLHENAEYEMKHIDYIFKNLESEFSVVLPGAEILMSDGKRIFFRRKETDGAIKPVKINRGEKTEFSVAGKNLSVYFSCQLPAEKNGVYIADADKVGNEIYIRSRMTGDIFHLGKRKCSKTLKKLFNEMKIPAEMRDTVIIIADEKGLIYIDGIGIDSFRSVNTDTKEYLIINTECENYGE